MKQRIVFPNCHAAVFGGTQSGKTFGTTQSLLHQKQGVLHFDMKEEPAKGYTQADGDDDWTVILQALHNGEKINYTPSQAFKYQEVAYLIGKLMQERLDVFTVCDECHLAYTNADKGKRAAQAAYEGLATTGLSRGLKGIFITQRPATLDNNLMMLSDYKVFFRTLNEEKYLAGYSIDGAELTARIGGRDHFYCTYYKEQIEGAFTV